MSSPSWTIGLSLVLKHRAEQSGFRVKGWVFGQLQALDFVAATRPVQSNPTLDGEVDRLQSVLAGRAQYLGLPVRVVGEQDVLRVEVE